MTKPNAILERLPRHFPPYNTVFHHRLMLAAAGLYLSPESRVLDFGCGSGKTVYEYRECGVDAYGFDIVNDVDLRRPEDIALFQLPAPGDQRPAADYRTDAADYRIGYGDASFDFVFSNSVFEHVQDHDLALREIARVLRHGGVSIHTFPARYRLIEPHIFVPVGGVVHNPHWYRIWALLGVRNRFQRDMGAAEVVRSNLQYCRTGINYPSVETILESAKRYFSAATLAPRLWTIGSVQHPLMRIPPLAWLYSRVATVVLWLEK